MKDPVLAREHPGSPLPKTSPGNAVTRAPVYEALKNATILITGGTGSFGNRVATRMLQLGPREIRIFSRDEKKQWEMQRTYPQFRYFIGDVRDAHSLAGALKGVDFVFHAAALKQVPSCEVFPWEAVQTNVQGTHNLCRAAIDAGVKVVVALSTDKAVKPVNAMGISKAMMEKVVCSQNRFSRDTVFCCVRYGNVMGSRGSVIPLFRKLIEERKPMTITVPQMTRFLLTLDQSVDLVFKAMTTSKGGEIFVRRAPACTVHDLARALGRKFSPQGADHPISITGARPGEKLHEVLVNEYEMQRAGREEEYFVIHPEFALPGDIRANQLGEEYTSENTQRFTDDDTLSDLIDQMGVYENYV